ncbi:MAG: sporulation protein YunB [Defluviitaleaceae bacterium]|nr:sporulation protein YunB [Defluviitaleaceae bacterium]
MKRKSWFKRLHRWRSSRGRKRHRSKSTWLIPRKYIALAMILTVIAAFSYSYYRFDRMILPLVLEAAEIHLQTEVNNVINQVIHEIISERNIAASDFIAQHTLAGESGPVLSINTVLVNDISNQAAMRISNRLNSLEPETVSVPMGMAFGLDTLSQVGPRVTFRMAPIGNALVDYDSRFTAVGINQVHFSVWLTIESEVRIINPVHSSTIYVTRHVSLVDTIISGVVPDTYLNMDVPQVNIN